MSSIILYQSETSEISIRVKAYFEDEKLIIEGYDIGSKVDELLGDTDYEYSVTIFPDEVKKIYPFFHVKENDKEELLKEIAGKFNTNSCFSEFKTYLDSNGINYESFSWV